jgi:hypothetical protein
MQSSISNIGSAIKHVQQTSMNSKANQEYVAKLQFPQALAFRSRQNDVDYTEFPVQVLPKTRIQTFYGREAQIEEIDAYLGNLRLDRLRTFTIYRRRDIGKTQVALKYAYLHESKFGEGNIPYKLLVANTVEETSQALGQSPHNAANEGFMSQYRDALLERIQILQQVAGESDRNDSIASGRRIVLPPEEHSLTDPSSMSRRALNKDLPINIKGRKLDASPDTGSDECCMPKDVADKLGLKVRCDPSDIKSFEKGDGKIFKSIGRTTVDCSFWKEPGRKMRCVVYVFEKLITPLIMGRKFLESTETLTRHQNRLVDRPPRAGFCRVMHLSRPKKRIRCYIDSELVNANPDTGAEMELVSPEFVKMKGYTVMAPDAEHEEVQFIDGSTARTQGQVTMRFEAYGDALQEAVPTKARYRKFYVLDGLTTDVLLGEDLLYGIKAFTEHASSFVDVDDLGQPLGLKGIVWLDRAEQRLARIFGGDISSISAQTNPGSTGKRLISK